MKLQKLFLLRHLPPALWAPYVVGWLQRERRRYVPCALPGCHQLLRIPQEDFYRSYKFFSENRQGRDELSFFIGHLRPNEVFYDVGGYRGVYAAAAKARFQSGLSVHLFEPVPANYEAIRVISQLNGFADFHIIPMAVADKPNLRGAITTQDLVFNSDHAADAKSAVDLQAISLDQYIARGASPPSLIKIDVDGFELAVLRGAKSCLSTDRPHLWIEIHPAFLQNQRSSSEEVLALLREIGYQIAFFKDYQSANASSPFHVWCE